MYSREYFLEHGQVQLVRSIEEERQVGRVALLERDWAEAYQTRVRVVGLMERALGVAEQFLAEEPLSEEETSWWRECLEQDINRAHEEVLEAQAELAERGGNREEAAEVLQEWWQRYATHLPGGPYTILEAQYLAAYTRAHRARESVSEEELAILDQLGARVGVRVLERRLREGTRAQEARQVAAVRAKRQRLVVGRLAAARPRR